MYLSEETPITIEDSNGSRSLPSDDEVASVAWRIIPISLIPRLALVIAAGSHIVFEPTKVVAGDVGLITFGPTKSDFVPDGLRVVVWFRSVDGIVSAGTTSPEIELFSEQVPKFSPQQPWVEYQFPLDAVVGTIGSFVMECSSASRARSGEGELGLYEFVVSDEESLDLMRARAFKQLRMRNEQMNLDAYYRHSLFQDNSSSAATDQNIQIDPNPDTTSESKVQKRLTDRNNSSLAFPKGHSTSQAQEPEQSTAQEALAAQEPPVATTTNAFFYSRELLVKKLGLTPPPFGWRLQTKLGEDNSTIKAELNSKFRVLSLCCGAARVETDFIRGISADRLKLTLFDLNPNLLNMAGQKLSERCEVETILGDVNELDLQGERFDIIMCVSGLHHVVELEHVIHVVARGLSDTGEFWSIGETVGRNGGKLWPESYEIANTFFGRLDRKYRINRTLGSVPDEELPDIDNSIGCFEGIRCEAIESNLLRFLSPIDVCKHNCIIWKLFSPSYFDNYDMQCPGDIALVEEAVDLDASLHQRGGRPIELNGIYGPRP